MKIILLFFILLITQITYSQNEASKTVLYAKRDAPINGIWLKLYENRECAIGFYGRSAPFNGTYQIKSDTLFMHFNAALPESMDSVMIFSGSFLYYVNSTGSLEILKNETVKLFGGQGPMKSGDIDSTESKIDKTDRRSRYVP